MTDGIIGIYDDYGYIAHYTNLTVYENAASDTSKFIHLISDGQMRQLLTDDIHTITRLIDSILVHHRQARSINILGTALKFIAGTPDFDDFEELKFNQQTLQKNNDRQVTINREMEIQIGKLTQAINNIQNSVKQNDDKGVYLFELLNSRNKAVIAELDTLSMSIVLGKLGLVNPRILNSQEIEKIFKDEKLQYVSINQVISNSKFRIRQNEKAVEILIKYPIVSEICNKIRIFPVIHDNKILLLEGNVTAKCNNKYKIVKCNTETEHAFCRETFQHYPCLEGLLNNNTAVCKYSSSHHISHITEVDDGVLIINNDFMRVKEPGKPPIFVNGTYLLTFSTSVELNETTFTNKKGAVFVSPEIPSTHKINISGHAQILSLPFLHELHLRNLEVVGSLKRHVKSHSYGFFIVITLIVFAWLSYLAYRKRKEKKTIKHVLSELKAVGTPAL